jgi:hypothetical protein
LPGAVAAAVGPERAGEQVHEREVRLRDGGIDRRVGRVVHPGAGRHLGAALLREQPAGPQAGERRVDRRVPVGVHAGRLHPPVPRVAVQVVGQHGLAGEGGQAQAEGDERGAGGQRDEERVLVHHAAHARLDRSHHAGTASPRVNTQPE